MKKLNANTIHTLAEGDYTDPLMPGLVLRVGRRKKTWVVRYRQGKVQKRASIGFWLGHNMPDGTGHLGLASAREKARELISRVEVGIPTTMAEPVHPKTDSETLGRAIDSYEKMKIRKGGRGTKSLGEAMRAVRTGLEEYLDLPVRQFSKADLRAARDEIAERGSLQMSDRFLAYCGPVFMWLAKEDRIDHSYVPEVLRVGPGLVRRDRILTPDEIRAIWKAAGEMESGHGYGRLIRFLLATGQRRSEGSNMRFGDLLDGRWRFTVKGGKEHRLRLPQFALDIIGEGDAKALVFPGRGGIPLAGWSDLKNDLDELSGVTGWRHHDLRRTCSSIMEDELGVPRDDVHAVLSHSKGDLAQVYMVGPGMQKITAALSVWNNHLNSILSNKNSAKEA